MKLVKTKNGLFHAFTPIVGTWSCRLLKVYRFIASASRDEVVDYLRDVALESLKDGSTSADGARFSFALSLLHDILASGGEVRIVDSSLWVAWPEWHTSDGREVLRRAMKVHQRPLTTSGNLNESSLREMFAGEMHAKEVCNFLENARFSLMSGAEIHPSGHSYSEAFSLAVKYWSMPYRGREGRANRFVVVGKHQHFEAPVVVGIIETGDDAPYSSIRDEELVLSEVGFKSWLNEFDADEVTEIATNISRRFQRIRAQLRVPEELKSLSAVDVLSVEKRLSEEASGRSGSAEGLSEKRKLSYLIRLSHGEHAFSMMARDGVGSAVWNRSLGKALRSFQNLTLPRIHTEVTICGAVPPFSVALAGKLVVSFIGHPAIVDSLRGSVGQILSDAFWAQGLEELLPNYGVLFVTTKGLYPGHSALYNRAGIPGKGTKGEEVRLRKLGNTKGDTAAMLSDTTTRLALRVLETASASAVSRVYGTGGAKRQRILTSAASASGLSSDLVHAGIQRPVYGVPLVTNLGRILWLEEEPDWRMERSWTSEQYSRAATKLWRSRWLPKAKRRLAGNRLIGGVIDELKSQAVDQESTVVS